MEAIIQEVREAIISRDSTDCLELIRGTLGQGVDLSRLVNEGMIPAMDVVGMQFARGEIFVPEMLVSAQLMKEALNLVKPLLAAGEVGGKGRVIMCTVKGDLHDIGKNLVSMMLEGAGMTVYDLGVNITAEQVASKVATLKPHVLGLSALLTTTMSEMENVIQTLTEKGIRDRVKVMVGGAPVSEEFAGKIGADGYASDAAGAVEMALALVAAFSSQSGHVS